MLEPIQGEAGIRVLDREAVRRVQEECARADCPIVVDEVQSGMGRSGAFFAASHPGLQGDYFTLAKSLGGGVAKAAMTLVRTSRYRKEFELVHSSTYAKDSFSTLIAGRTVALLEADGGRAYRLAEERGNRLLAMLEGLRKEYGTVVKDVRGRGLMAGLEFHDQSGSPTPRSTARRRPCARSSPSWPTTTARRSCTAEPSPNGGVPPPGRGFAEGGRPVSGCRRRTRGRPTS
ncbi:aminotransferase class III-fold pyridoxal phosphate-dependent enzyme [Streptomyces sp. NPDC046727]|uniref:aminotransferase class III-fold pyridoxal phosphate-dependent enzyme n=1 Tax=Streptomyces sp. NPDC046727 TaxID=3155373 RepID=UPI0033F7346D